MKRLQETELQGTTCHELLAYATSRVAVACERYLTDPNWHLFAHEENGNLTGIIGIQLIAADQAILQHIVVSPHSRTHGIGSHMIDFVCHHFSLTHLEAETDKDAVHFYRKYGFTIQSLGEKYPGVERFHCLLSTQPKNSP